MLKSFVTSLIFILIPSIIVCQPDIQQIKIYPDDSVGIFDKLELRFRLKQYANNYDSDIVKVDAFFTSPSGITYTVPGFYYIDYVKQPDFDCGLDLPCESLAVAKWQPYNWVVRFTPNETGNWVYEVVVKDKNGTQVLTNSQKNTFNCKHSDKTGFISKRNNRYLQKGNQPIFLVGTNACWYGRDVFSKPIANELGTNDYIRYFDILEESKANFTKVWINHSAGISLTGREWTTNKVHGFDDYNQKDAWQLDRIFELAEQRNIYIILCMFQQNALVNSYGVKNWGENNAFNRAVNSECDYTINSPFEFFSDSNARKLTKDLFRYMIARWGYATNLVAWKIFTEIEQVENIWRKSKVTPPKDYLENVFNWHSDMAAYIRSIDAFSHMITTSSPNKYSNGGKEYPGVFYDMDLTISHDYKGVNTLDDIKIFEKHLLTRANNYMNEKGLQDKPYMSQEWGVTPGKELTEIDPVGYAFHNCLWSSAMSGAFGSVLSWEWDTYLLKKNLFIRLKPVSEFMNSVISELDGSIAGKRIHNNGISTFYAENSSNGVIIGWCQDDHFDFSAVKNTSYIKNLKSSKPKVSSRNNAIEIPVSGKNRYYRIQWYDTNTARWIEERSVESKGNILSFKMPVSLRRSTFGDGAFVLKPVN